MTTPSFVYIDDIFTNKQFLINQSTSLYDLIIQETPEIAEGWLYVVLYNKDPLNNILLEKPNLYYSSFINRTFYKTTSNGTLYKNSFSYQENDSLTVKNIYWLFLNNQLDSWTPFSDNYITSEQNNFYYVWYCFSNLNYNLSGDVSYLGDNYYSQPLVKKNSDQEFLNNDPIHTEQNKSLFIIDSTDILWSSNITEKYLRVYIQGYKSSI